ncbi:hypothetical protein [Leptospira haakeii]|uniref:Uncharacterized protein n=1 Tax=Leptospira haakeii TaxID=2023198 RepID=A0ABX4PNP4_9LEPT|nr:hypothetical protein [Leptospira haakeii]PKA17275.1 hypothetical protein CH363_01080 [Leptospira haakeii]PKA20999.1 hypothetical protein CH377_01080 [Leptospira haakeii]
MNIVLVFRRKILGYGFACEEGELSYESNRIRDRLDRYLLENHIPKRCIAEKFENFGKVFKGFIGFFEEDIPGFSKNLEEVEIETGKYLKFGNLSSEDDLGARFCINKKVQTYLEENNIRTDWMRFSSGKNSYLRIIN